MHSLGFSLKRTFLNTNDCKMYTKYILTFNLISWTITTANSLNRHNPWIYRQLVNPSKTNTRGHPIVIDLSAPRSTTHSQPFNVEARKAICLTPIKRNHRFDSFKFPYKGPADLFSIAFVQQSEPGHKMHKRVVESVCFSFDWVQSLCWGGD